jgi:hypothetical protein
MVTATALTGSDTCMPCPIWSPSYCAPVSAPFFVRLATNPKAHPPQPLAIAVPVSVANEPHQIS